MEKWEKEAWKIGICDDDQRERLKLKTLCRDILEKENLLYRIMEFASGEEVLAHEGEIEVLLLDIEMPGMNGITLKAELQKNDRVGMIIYVTSHEELMPEAFGLRVFGFVRKDRIEKTLPALLRTATGMKNPHTLIEGKIDSRTILYIEADYGYSKVVCVDGKTRLERITLDHLEKLLVPCDFVRVHRKYLVNMRKIDRLTEKEIVLGAQRLPVSVRMRSRVKKTYDSFVRRNARYC